MLAMLLSALLMSPSVMAQSIDHEAFDVVSIEKKFNAIEAKLPILLSHSNDLSQLMIVLNELQNEIKICMKDNSASLHQINVLLQEITQSSFFKVGTASNESLQHEKTQYINNLSFCRFYSYKIQEMRKKITEQQTSTLENMWLPTQPSFLVSWDNFLRATSMINFDLLYQKSGFKYIYTHPLSRVVVMCILCVFLVYVAWLGWVSWCHATTKKKKCMTIIHDRWMTRLVFFLPLVLITVYFNILLNSVVPHSLLVMFLDSICVYFLFLFVVKWYLIWGEQGKFNAIKEKMHVIVYSLVLMSLLFNVWTISIVQDFNTVAPAELMQLKHALYVFVFLKYVLLLISKPHTFFTKKMKALIIKRTYILMSLVFACEMLFLVLKDQPMPPGFFYTLNSFYITCLNLVLWWLSWRMMKNWLHKHHVSQHISWALKISVNLLYSVIIALAWVGYHTLSMFFIFNLLTSIIILWMMFDLMKFIQSIYVKLSAPDQKVSQALRRFLRITPHDTLTEFLALQFLGYLMTGVLVVLGLINIWTNNLITVKLGYGILNHGISIFSFTVYPSKLAHAANFFCFMIVVGRILSYRVKTNNFGTDQKDMQRMLMVVIHYASVALGLLCALFIAGVSYNGLLVGLGGVGIGIGLGLQDLAKDFFSGILIFVTKPVNTGDHVLIDFTEGFIKKIGLLSTQMRTLTHADIIIPNALIVKNSVINYTFHKNRLARININVSLLDNHDFDNAKKMLLDIVSNLPAVIQNEPYQPVVLFHVDHLELSCFIDEVNNKPFVLSALHLAILRVFEEAKIAIKVS